MRPIRNGLALLGTFASQILCQAMDISYVCSREGWLYLALANVLGPMVDKIS